MYLYIYVYIYIFIYIYLSIYLCIYIYIYIYIGQPLAIETDLLVPNLLVPKYMHI